MKAQRFLGKARRRGCAQFVSRLAIAICLTYIVGQVTSFPSNAAWNAQRANVPTFRAKIEG